MTEARHSEDAYPAADTICFQVLPFCIPKKMELSGLVDNCGKYNCRHWFVALENHESVFLRDCKYIGRMDSSIGYCRYIHDGKVAIGSIACIETIADLPQPNISGTFYSLSEAAMNQCQW